MIRIVDLTHYVAGPFATLLLAELGVDVIKIEPPSGDPWRYHGCRGDWTGFDFLNRRKRSIVLDLKTRAGRSAFLRLVAGADAVVENFRPGTLARLRLAYPVLRRANRRMVLTSISNFGQTGPRRDWQASELVLQSMGGIVAGTGWDGEAPMKLGGSVAAHIGGLNAAIATLASIYGVRAGAEGGVWNDISIQEAFAAHWARHISQWVYSGTRTTRERREAGRQGFPHTLMARDGPIYLLALRAEWEEFAFFFGLDQFIGPEWSDPSVRAARWSEVDPYFRAAVAARDRQELFASGAEHGYTFAPIDEPHSILASPQLAARGFFQPAELRNGQILPCPGLPFSGFPQPPAPNRAPRLGEHTRAILG